MKIKKAIKIITLLLSILLVLLSPLIYKILFTTYFQTRGELIETYKSEDGRLRADVYEQTGNATSGIITRVLIIENSNKLFKLDKLIYLARKPYKEHDFYWDDDESFVINDLKLNVYKDKYIHPGIQD